MSVRSLTENNKNIAYVRNQIYLKNGYDPYYSTINNIQSTSTEINHHPFNKWFRGVYNSSQPFICEREAGFVSNKDMYYNSKITDNTEITYPNHCFEGACSTVYPCNTNKTNRNLLNTSLTDCNIKYR
jgi:hypothetical protein